MNRVPFHVQILAAMLLGGAAGLGLNLGSASGAVDSATAGAVAAGGRWFGQLFLAALNMVVVPLVFSSLLTAVLDLGGREGMARLGARTLTYYAATSTLAIGTGLVLVNLIRPGDGVDYAALMVSAQESGATAPPPPEVAMGGVGAVLADLVLRMIPTNVVHAASSNATILGLIVFALAFGVAAVRSGPDTVAALRPFFGAVLAATTTLTQGVLRLAPLGIGGYLLFVTASTGLDLARPLLAYGATVALGLAVHGGVTLPLILWALAGRDPLAWARSMREALLTAFSTASSSGTLPLTLDCARRAGVSDRVASFTLPLGATVNMDGTALYEAVAVLFVAQMLGDLTIGQQVVVAFTALLASVGAAGIPHAGTVMMVIVLQAVGLPTDAVLVILSVDRVLDMARTTVNVWSDMVGAAVVSRLEGEG